MTNRRRILVGGGAALLAAGGATWAGMRQMGSMDDQAAAAASMRTTLPPSPEKLDLIRYAALAANSHNTQPWRADFRRSIPTTITCLQVSAARPRAFILRLAPVGRQAR